MAKCPIHNIALPSKDGVCPLCGKNQLPPGERNGMPAIPGDGALPKQRSQNKREISALKMALLSLGMIIPLVFGFVSIGLGGPSHSTLFYLSGTIGCILAILAIGKAIGSHAGPISKIVTIIFAVLALLPHGFVATLGVFTLLGRILG